MPTQAIELTLPSLMSPAEFRVLGVRVHAVTIADTIREVEGWIQARAQTQFIAVTGMHGITEAQSNPAFKNVLNNSGLTVPDGMPLVWIARWYGFPLRRRVYGPEFMLEFCRLTENKSYKHFFYGGADGVAEQLANTLTSKFPGIVIAGAFAPPFRPLTEQEEANLKDVIAAADPDIIWVGLSTPKQECWMFEHRSCFRAPVMVGVGAAFDLNTGRLRQAPRWMRENGLEWFFRLLAEPKRLWKRYLLLGSKFVIMVLAELSGARKFDQD